MILSISLCGAEPEAPGARLPLPHPRRRGNRGPGVGWSTGLGVSRATCSAAGRGTCQDGTPLGRALSLQSETSGTRAKPTGRALQRGWARRAPAGRRGPPAGRSRPRCAVQAGPGARAGARRRRPGSPSGTCGPGRARAPGSSTPTAPAARPAALMEVQTFGGGRRCRGWAGARRARPGIYMKQARERIVGPRAPQPAGRV